MREMGFISKIKAGGEWAKEGMGIEDGEGEGGGGKGRGLESVLATVFGYYII